AMRIVERVGSRLTGAFVVAALAVVLPAVSARAGCAPTPPSPELCASLGQTSLAIDANGRFEWRASHAPADSATRFADPAGDYKLCVWDEEHLVVAADIPPDAECDGRSCWNATATRYRDEL